MGAWSSINIISFSTMYLLTFLLCFNLILLTADFITSHKSTWLVLGFLFLHASIVVTDHKSSIKLKSGKVF